MTLHRGPGSTFAGGTRRRPPLLLLALAAAAGLLASACSTGAYPFDLFPEMHYQQSYRSQEPPRLDVPKDSVPVAAPTATRTGAQLYAINCAMCHGQDLKGDGAVLQTLREKYGYTPLLDPDLTSDTVKRQTDQGLAGLIGTGVNVMPPFRKLLTAEEVQLLVAYLREASGAPQPPPRPPSPPAVGAELGRQVFTTLSAPACATCHTIAGLSTGAVGPELTHIGTVAVTRRPGVTAEEYIRQSIVDPGAFVVSGFANIMPPGYGQSLPKEQLDALVAFLLAQR